MIPDDPIAEMTPEELRTELRRAIRDRDMCRSSLVAIVSTVVSVVEDALHGMGMSEPEVVPRGSDQPLPGEVYLPRHAERRVADAGRLSP